ncbi:hypothetical protein QUF56_09415 [Ureibacillus composti]|nr:hypothetical protein [Ureibacillus composti]
MAEPKVTITSISKRKISDESGHDQSIIKFTCDQTIVAFEVRAGGIFQGSGLLVGMSDSLYPSSSLYPSNSLYPINFKVTAGTVLQFDIENEELQQDGEYRINIYALNEQGEWTPYE